jgi:hypothetical protein
MPYGGGDTLETVGVIHSALIRTGFAWLIVLTVGAAPALLEYCASSCEAHKAAHGTSQPSCHHSATSSSEIAPPANPCGHDHAGFVAAFLANGVATAPQLQPVAMLTTVVIVPTPTQQLNLSTAAAQSGPPLTDSIRPLPLRI